MPKLTGVFELFDNLDKISPNSLNNWLKNREEPHYLQNFVGNRILYPQIVPTTKREMDLDFALLGEAVKLNRQLFFDEQSKRVIIPEVFLSRFPNLPRLGVVMVEGISPQGESTIYLKTKSGHQFLGTVIAPTLISSDGPMQITINSKVSNVSLGSLVVFPITSPKVRVKIDALAEIEVSGGELGLIIDLRKGVNLPG